MFHQIQSTHFISGLIAEWSNEKQLILIYVHPKTIKNYPTLPKDGQWNLFQQISTFFCPLEGTSDFAADLLKQRKDCWFFGQYFSPRSHARPRIRSIISSLYKTIDKWPIVRTTIFLLKNGKRSGVDPREYNAYGNSLFYVFTDTASSQVTLKKNNLYASIVYRIGSKRRMFYWFRQRQKPLRLWKLVSREQNLLFLFFLCHPSFPFFFTRKLESKFLLKLFFNFDQYLLFYGGISFWWRYLGWPGDH